jgi:hypothetical protein
VAKDAFNRTVVDAWGTADTGGSWVVLSGGASNFDVNGSRGAVTLPNGSQRLAHLPSASALDVDASVEVTFPDGSSTNEQQFAYLVLRRQAGGSYYRVGVYRTSTGIWISGQTDSGTNLFSPVATGLTFSPGDVFQLRVQAQGANPTTLRAKVWKKGTSEPVSWNVTTTSSASGLQTAGTIGIRAIKNPSNPTRVLEFDNLRVKPL